MENRSTKRKAAQFQNDSNPSSQESSSSSESENSAHNSTSAPPSKRPRSHVPAEIEVDITAPTPPTKRALRLLKKGKAAPPLKSDNRPDSASDDEGSADSEAGATSKSKSKRAQEPVEKRSEHGVWIGNLPWSCDRQALRKFFTNSSGITDDDITRIHMPLPAGSKPTQDIGKKKQNNKGFAYVDFASAEHVQMALELSEELLTGRRVLIKDQKSFEGRPEKTKEEKIAEAKPPNKRVFVGNLRYDATVASLTSHFGRCGPIDTVFVATFEDSGKCKGYAWVTFTELDAAERAVKGWFMVPTERDDEDAIKDKTDAQSNSDVDDHTVQARSRFSGPKMQKVWVNQIFGRPVRREFAEDAQVRYKKRYGKDGTKNSAVSSEAEVSKGVSNGGTSFESAQAKTSNAAIPRARPTESYREAYVPRLTGGVVPSTGKKITF